MRCGKLIEILEELAPLSCACEWDNPGLLAGRRDKDIKRILLAVDADDRAVEEALRVRADMILTHHPLIFKAIKSVTDGDFIGRRLVSMIQADMVYYAAHTNFDAAPGCMADLAAGKLGIENGLPLDQMGELNGIPYGIGKIGRLNEPVSGMELARRVKEEFHLPYAVVYGSGLWEETMVTMAAVCPGSGGSIIGAAVNGGAQALVTGDIGHHEGIDAAAQGLMIIDAGHFGLESVFMDFMEGYLRNKLGEQLDMEIYKMPRIFPTAVV